MTRETRCDCCDLPVASCGKFAENLHRAHANARRKAIAAQSGVLASFHASRCPICDQPMPVGTLIRFSELTETGWIHADPEDCK